MLVLVGLVPVNRIRIGSIGIEFPMFQSTLIQSEKVIQDRMLPRDLPYKQERLSKNSNINFTQKYHGYEIEWIRFIDRSKRL